MPVSNVQSTILSNPRDIETITNEVNRCKVRGAAAMLEIGRLLIEAKAQLGFGCWLDWLHGSVKIPERTAQNLMKLARAYSNPKLVADLGEVKALTLLALPEAQRESFVEELHEVNGAVKRVAEMNKHEFRAAIRRQNGTAPNKSSDSGSNLFRPIRKTRGKGEPVRAETDFDTKMEALRGLLNSLRVTVESAKGDKFERRCQALTSCLEETLASLNDKHEKRFPDVLLQRTQDNEGDSNVREIP